MHINLSVHNNLSKQNGTLIKKKWSTVLKIKNKKKSATL